MESVARVERESGQSQIIVPTPKGELVYAYPLFSEFSINDYRRAITSKGFQVATGDYVHPLLHAAFCANSRDPQFEGFKQSLRDGYLYPFLINVFSHNGVYVIQDDKTEGRAVIYEDLELLEDMLLGGTTEKGIRFSKDGKVRFAPENTYRCGEVYPEEMKTNGWIIAGYGFDGAENLAKISERLEDLPILDIGKNPPFLCQRKSCIYFDKEPCEDDTKRLVFDGMLQYNYPGDSYGVGFKPNK